MNITCLPMNLLNVQTFKCDSEKKSVALIIYFPDSSATIH